MVTAAMPIFRTSAIIDIINQHPYIDARPEGGEV
jgi:hypothetical protein